MKYAFISFVTYGSRALQYDCDAFAAEDSVTLNKAVLREASILQANGHSHFVVHSTISAETAKKWDVTIHIVK